MPLLEAIENLAAGGFAFFGIWAFIVRGKKTPTELVLSPSPLAFASQLSMAIFLLCAAIEAGTREIGSVRTLLYSIASLCGFISLFLAYRKLHNRSNGELGVAPNRSLAPNLKSESSVRGSED
jgi:hypothetical protein